MFVCLYVCLLLTWEWEGQLPPNFQGSSRAPRGWFKVQNSWGRGFG